MMTTRPTFALLLMYFLISSFSLQQSETYTQLKEKIRNTRLHFQEAYYCADSTQMVTLIDSVKAYLLNTIVTELIPPWYGTPWEFYGQSRTPGKGAIACGYFVTGILYDAGFDIPRVKWAQLAAESIVLKVSKDIKRFRNRPIQEVQAYIKNREDGIYIVGLDHHVGFVIKYNQLIRFVHSNYYHQYIGVMSEELDTDNPLKDSSYRILGKILDDRMVIRWIENRRIE